MSIPAAIESEAEPAVRRRTAAGSYNNTGDYVPGAEVATAITGMFAPSYGKTSRGGRSIMEAPEGVIEEAEWFLFTNFEIVRDDVIERSSDGTKYRVVATKNYSHLGAGWAATLAHEPD